MNPSKDNELRDLLQQAMPRAADSELSHDLWPRMAQQLSHQPNRVPWFDWALAAFAGGALIFFPGILPALFYHL